MAIGRNKPKQEQIWISATHVRQSPAHPFYEKVNEILETAGFDKFVETACAKFYAATLGRPGLAPGRYFRALLVGYFEGIDSERGIAWRAADSMAIRSFLNLRLEDESPDHSTLARTRRLIDSETHLAVFSWVQKLLEQGKLFNGKTIGVDATNLEANAAMRSIVRRDTDEMYTVYVTRLMKESGMANPTTEEVKSFDRKRQKRMSNEEWRHPGEKDAQIGKMKDGSTHMAHKVEHAIDLESGAIVAITLHGGAEGDTTTLSQTIDAANEQLKNVIPAGSVERHSDNPQPVQTQVDPAPELETPETSTQAANTSAPRTVQYLVADKGYHSYQNLIDLQKVGIQSYIPEPKLARRNWQTNQAAKIPFDDNQSRTRNSHGQTLRRARAELVERSFAHLYETGAMRRTHLRHHNNILKRLYIHAGAFNLGLLIRKQTGVGKPRSQTRAKLAQLGTVR